MKHNRLLYLALASSILVILIAFFQWYLIDIITEFLMLPIWLVIFGFFIFITVKTIINLFKNKGWKPFTIQLLTILLWLFFPFTQVMLDLDFKLNKSERDDVVEMVKNGTLKPNVSYDSSLIQLPEKYDQLSKGGGEIVIEKNSDLVLFFTYRGILDNFSGFVYSPNGKKPNQSDFDGDFKKIEKLDENWYFVGSY
ncbi:hypothetical protein J7I96_24445 [Bacillus sp. ISL-78]|uniref:hypothetical protein n=1 Tax=Bacillus sp. ISL-101 TaxID=2819117 RepID=UPI001BE50EDE|nr:hypothetical protein [Bacillus sp. ISL-101]MBT2618503.1 hypothetical protein [Bacillus sp. ISL-78]MBT2632667.1 hypothetical protein [Bacillus sp. ISL-101]